MFDAAKACRTYTRINELANMNNQINTYLNKFLIDEYQIVEPFKSNGEVENQFILMTELIKKQDILIKELSKQKDTANTSGIFKNWIEFQNTLWRFVLGDPDQLYCNYLKFSKYRHLASQFENFCSRIRAESSPIDVMLPRRLFIDVTNTCQTEKMTGIQRVVFELSRRLLDSDAYLVLLSDNGTLFYNKVSGIQENITFTDGDIFLMPEIGIDHSNLLAVAMSKIKLAGGMNVSIVYDLIPINYPLTCAPAVSYKFHHWMKNCALRSDLVLTNTKSVVSQVQKFAGECLNKEKFSPKIDHFKLGSELPLIDPRKVIPKTQRVSFPTDNIFLSVGTLEPRKGYSISLDAADKAWLSGADFIYIIVGRYGWSQAKLRERILNHDLYGKKLIWFDNLDDAELAYFYQISKRLICSSLDEGFGLPLMEAAQHGLAVIASDISVFREIAGDSTRFFEVANHDQLAKEIISACSSPKTITSAEPISWNSATNELIERIRANRS